MLKKDVFYEYIGHTRVKNEEIEQERPSQSQIIVPTQPIVTSLCHAVGQKSLDHIVEK